MKSLLSVITNNLLNPFFESISQCKPLGPINLSNKITGKNDPLNLSYKNRNATNLSRFV